MKQKIKTLVTILCLAATSVVTIATSKAKDGATDPYLNDQNMARKNYLVASNCPQAIQQERITVEGMTILEPRNRLFSDYGLPLDVMNFQTNSVVHGYFQGQQRTCQLSTVVHSGTPLQVYTCYQNNYQICQVSFEQETNY